MGYWTFSMLSLSLWTVGRHNRPRPSHHRRGSEGQRDERYRHNIYLNYCGRQNVMAVTGLSLVE